MKQSQLFTKTRKEAPAGEVSKNAELLIRGGFIHKEMAGVYAYLPLGLRTFNKIINVIRTEMNAIGGQEVELTALQDPEIWKKTGRWDDEVIDVWFKTMLAGGTEVGIGNTHEEPLANAMTHHINSYKDLPVSVYQFQTKFRNELRAKSGLMRTREFIMKDLYSFSRTEEEFREFYEVVAEAYMRIFDHLGVGNRTYRTYASGGAFSKFSDEFQTLSDAGEDIVYVDSKRNIAVNKEVYTDEVLEELGLKKDELEPHKAIEVGNIFPLGTKYSEAFGLMFKDEDGKDRPVVMGSYGIGPGRVMGAIAETFADDKGIVWPARIAPFAFHILEIGKSDAVHQFAAELYTSLSEQSIEALWDDRNMSAGEKFADADLIGIPFQIIISDRGLSAGEVELKERESGKTSLVNEADVVNALQRIVKDKEV